MDRLSDLYSIEQHILSNHWLVLFSITKRSSLLPGPPLLQFRSGFETSANVMGQLRLHGRLLGNRLQRRAASIKRLRLALLPGLPRHGHGLLRGPDSGLVRRRE